MSRVLLINGSPNEFGCTYTALSEVKKSLEKNGVAAEIYYLGKPAIHGCTGCDACSKLDRCVYDDAVNAVAARLDEFDGIVVGSPVHYSGPSAQVCAFMDRLFCSAGERLQYKLAAAVVSCRRGGNSCFCCRNSICTRKGLTRPQINAILSHDHTVWWPGLLQRSNGWISVALFS